MGRLRVALIFLLGLFITFAIPFFIRVPEECTTVYNKRGVSAILKSSKCYHWIQSTQSVQNQTKNCQFTTDQGEAKFNYIRISCNLDLHIPFPGNYGTEVVRTSVVAVFDGRLGEEASEMASTLLLDYFLVHSVFSAFKGKLSGSEEHFMVSEVRNNVNFWSSNRSLPVISNESKRMIFKEALIRSIHDIHSTFSKEALKRHIIAGSTATIAVLVDGHLLVANVGNSKAVLCSKNTHSHKDVEGNNVPFLYAKQLTDDHSPSRAVERERLVAAGGSVIFWGGRYWANGVFTLTRAIGFKFVNSDGVISEPEVTDWQPLTSNNTHLVVATNGLFFKLTPQNVCDILHSPPDHCISSATSSDCIASMAYKEGTKSSLSVIVVPLESDSFSQDPFREKM